MPIVLPTNGKVQQAKLKKVLPAKDGRPEKSIWKCRVTVGDEFVDCEVYGGEIPAVGSELSVEASEYGPKGKRPGSSKGWGGGGGGRRGDDPETRSSIEGQVAAKLLTELVVADKATPEQRQALDGWIGERVA